MKNTNTDRKYYALYWLHGNEFAFYYDTIPELGMPVATVVLFDNKHKRDEYVDRWPIAESIPEDIARKLIKHGVSYCEESDNR